MPMPLANPEIPRWLRGPVEGVPDVLQPVAHALLQSVDDLTAEVADLEVARLRARPGGVAPITFHLLHIAGSSERLFAYAEGRELTEAERERLVLERSPDEIPTDGLLGAVTTTLRGLVSRLGSFEGAALLEPRAVGSKQLPSTVLGLLMHAAEHAQRHTGQVVTTVRLLAGLVAERNDNQ